jgi:hypothetical protein
MLVSGLNSDAPPGSQDRGNEMNANYGFTCRAAFALATVCTALLVCNMAAMPIYKQQIFLERGTITTGGEMVILIGFVLVLMFNVMSLLWVSSRIRKAEAVHMGDITVLTLGALCLILLVGEKVMVDEIGREYLLGWEVVGEWVILYVFLTIQLLYNFIILRRVYRVCRNAPPPSDRHSSNQLEP